MVDPIRVTFDPEQRCLLDEDGNRFEGKRTGNPFILPGLINPSTGSSSTLLRDITEEQAVEEIKKLEGVVAYEHLATEIITCEWGYDLPDTFDGRAVYLLYGNSDYSKQRENLPNPIEPFFRVRFDLTKKALMKGDEEYKGTRIGEPVILEGKTHQSILYSLNRELNRQKAEAGELISLKKWLTYEPEGGEQKKFKNTAVALLYK